MPNRFFKYPVGLPCLKRNFFKTSTILRIIWGKHQNDWPDPRIHQKYSISNFILIFSTFNFLFLCLGEFFSACWRWKTNKRANDTKALKFIRLKGKRCILTIRLTFCYFLFQHLLSQKIKWTYNSNWIILMLIFKVGLLNFMFKFKQIL